MKRSLLIISCSDSKDGAPGLLPAYKRYKGQYYITLCKACREGYFPENLDILIISAEYGLLRWDEPIKCYNQKMCSERANELRPSIEKKLKAFLNEKDYDQLFIALSQVYRSTLEGFNLDKYFRVVKEGDNNRGKKRRDTIAWIKELFENEQAE